jgi:gas vesicle protein
MTLELKQRGLLVGAVIGAVLGAGAAYLLLTAPPHPAEGEEPKPIKARELLALTGSAAILLRKLDDIRRRT